MNLAEQQIKDKVVAYVGVAAYDVIKERSEHFTKHERFIPHDSYYNKEGQLTSGAVGLIQVGIDKDFDNVWERMVPPGWDKDLWVKMLKKSERERLVIAASLILAEIDRIDYDSITNSQIPDASHSR